VKKKSKKHSPKQKHLPQILKTTNAPASSPTENEQIQTMVDQREIQFSAPTLSVDGFAVFDVVEDVGNHYFRNETEAAPGRNFITIVYKEWDNLKKNLPEGIYVRGYESRMDLMKIGIIGPRGTPYYLGLYMFDLRLPSNYPNQPPSLYYCTPIGQRFNPNLYENGRVCLSLLGTWSGRGVEVWDPTSSTILQLVISIQGLILGTPEPYFLEPGYEKQKGTVLGNRSSILYNENAFLMSLQAIINTIRHPPQHFQSLVFSHFCSHSDFLLHSCQNYLQAARTNQKQKLETQNKISSDKSGDGNGNGEERDEEQDEGEKNFAVPLSPSPSTGFVRELEKLLVKLNELKSQEQLYLSRTRSAPPST